MNSSVCVSEDATVYVVCVGKDQVSRTFSQLVTSRFCPSDSRLCQTPRTCLWTKYPVSQLCGHVAKTM